MSVVVSLLRAIDRADGEALVMHVGEKPYVVTPQGQAELAARVLTVPAMTGMLDQILPPESRRALDELGAVEYHLPPDDAAPDVRYSVVAARGGDDIWIELRRRKEEPAPEPRPETAPPESVVDSEPAIVMAPDAVAAVTPEPAVAIAPESFASVPSELYAAVSSEAFLGISSEPSLFRAPSEYELPAIGEPMLDRDGEPTGDMLAALERMAAPDPEPLVLVPHDDPRDADSYRLDGAFSPTPDADPFSEPPTFESHGSASAQMPPEPGRFFASAEADDEGAHHLVFEPVPRADGDAPRPALHPVTPAEQPRRAEPAVHAREPEHAPANTPEAQPVGVPDPAINQAVTTASVSTPVAAPPIPVQADATTSAAPAVVVSIARGSSRAESAPSPEPAAEGLGYLLQIAAAQGASALYIAARAKPSLRVDGEIRVLDDAPLTEAQLETGLRQLLPRHESLPLGEVETCEVSDIGRVQVLAFRDHRGLGAMFRMLPARAISAEHIGLSPSIQALCTEPEGLVLVAGARGSGKSTLMAALVDQINLTRRDHVITVESQIQYVHENRTSFVSQREARGEDAFAETVRNVLRETPDVIVLDQVNTSEVAEFALNAAAGGHLVLAALTASTTVDALSRFVELLGSRQPQARVTLSEHLRGVITQTLLRKTGGGRAAAREVLISVPSVASLVAESQLDQLGAVLNSGRKIGMVPLNDALLGLVQAGALDVREAHRKSPDPQELLAMLSRAGVDTAFAERFA